MIRRAAFPALLLAFVLASWLGWWAVPATAALWGAFRPRVSRPMLRAALAAGLGWLGWLLVDAASDPAALQRIGEQLAAILRLPLPVLLLLTLLFPAMLAWSAAALGCGLATLLNPRAGATR